MTAPTPTTASTETPAEGGATDTTGAAAGEGASSTTGGQAPPADTGGGGGAAPKPGDGVRPRDKDKTETVRTAARDTGGDAGGEKPAAGKTEPAGQAPTGGDGWRLEDLPPGARKHIESLRKENGKNRTEAITAKETAAAADERFAGAVEAFTKALGLTPPAEENAPPPEQQLADITNAYREKTVELAVYRAAGPHGGDAEALLDSRAFLTRALALDPAADGFDTQVADAIRDAVQENPKLRAAAPAAAAPAPSGGEFRGGPAAVDNPEDWSVDTFRKKRADALNGAHAS